MKRLAATLQWDGLREPHWAIGAVVGALAIALVVAARPWFAAGVTVGGFLLLLLLTRPLALLGGMLAVGAVDLSFITGGRKTLLSGMGGLDMNGIRLVGLVAGIVLLLIIDRRFDRWVFGRLGRWYLLFLAFGAASLLMSPDRVEGLRLLFKLAYPLLVFIAVCGLVETRYDLERLGDWVLGAAAILALVVNPLIVLSGGYVIDARGYLRIGGLGMGTSAFSFYVLAMLFLAYARFSVRGQVRYLALGAVLAAWVIPTLTRTALGGALAGLGAAAVFGALAARNYRGLAAAVALGAVVAVPLAPVALERTFGYVPSLGQLWSLMGDPVALYEAIYWTGRDSLWAAVVPAFLSSPIVGMGLGASTAILVSNTPSGWATVVHNEYLRLLTDTGVIGFGLFAVAIAVWCVAALRAGRTQDRLAREYAMPAFAGIVAWAVISFPGNALDYYAQYTQYIGFFVAGAVTAARLARETEGAPSVGGDGDGAAVDDAKLHVDGEEHHVPAR